MDSYLLQRTKLNNSFARFQIRETGKARPSLKPAYGGFCFVGKNASSVQKLVRAFRQGYVSEDFDNAKTELRRCLLKEKDSIPEVIICESHGGFKEIQAFCRFLNEHPVLSVIPVLLDGTGLDAAERKVHQRAKLVDEIVFLNQLSGLALQSKTRFLKKVKTKAADPRNAAQFEETGAGTFYLKNFVKRLSDIILSIILLCIMSPFFLLIALAIALESGGPVFYVSKRAGMGYRIFNFYKFRTMQVGADKFVSEYAHLNLYRAKESGRPFFVKIPNDPRITKVGSLLRQTGLDELPQLFNVLLGDMSLVGNRPLPLYEAETLTTDRNAQRFLAPAGITGLWQIKKRGREAMSAEERVNLDIDYAKKYNFMYDLWIMMNTIEYPVSSSTELKHTKVTSLT